MKTWMIVSLGLVVAAAPACKKSAKDAGAGSGSGSGSATALVGSGSGSGSGSATAGAPKKPLPLPATGQVFLLAEKPGGKIKVQGDDGKPAELDDGLIVETSEAPETAKEPKTDGHDRWDHVTVAGKGYFVPGAYVVEGTSVDSSPDGHFAVVAMVDSCGDFCHSIVWLTHGLDERWKVFDAVDPKPAWLSTEVAIGGDGETKLFSLPEVKELRKLDGYLPVYSPTGVLYLRSPEWDVLEMQKDGKLKKVGGEKRPEDHNDEVDGPAEPTPIEFDDHGKWKLAAPAGPH